MKLKIILSFCFLLMLLSDHFGQQYAFELNLGNKMTSHFFQDFDFNYEYALKAGVPFRSFNIMAGFIFNNYNKFDYREDISGKLLFLNLGLDIIYSLKYNPLILLTAGFEYPILIREEYVEDEDTLERTKRLIPLIGIGYGRIHSGLQLFLLYKYYSYENRFQTRDILSNIYFQTTDKVHFGQLQLSFRITFQ